MNLDKYVFYTANEASKKLGKSRNYVINLIKFYPTRLLKGSYKKVGDRTYIITQEGVDHLQMQIEKIDQKKTENSNNKN